jgi:hypothetical protein
MDWPNLNRRTQRGLEPQPQDAGVSLPLGVQSLRFQAQSWLESFAGKAKVCGIVVQR